MTPTCQTLIDDYLAWLRSAMRCKSIGDSLEISTPFLDSHNDMIQFYATQSEDGCRISDDFAYLSELEMAGCPVDSPSRQRILQRVLRRRGVQNTEGELIIDARPEHTSDAIHSMIQAIIEVNSMQMLAHQQGGELFQETVAEFLEAHGVSFEPAPNIKGKSGYSHHFDFVIPSSGSRPERMINTVGKPTKAAASQTLFAWSDAQGILSSSTELVVIVNDQDKKVTQAFKAAMKRFGARLIPWTKRMEHIGDLAS